MTKPIDDNCRDLFDEVSVKAVMDLVRDGSIEQAASLYDLIEDDRTKGFILSETHDGRPLSQILGRQTPAEASTPSRDEVNEFYDQMSSLFNPSPPQETASPTPAEPAQRPSDPLREAVQQSLSGSPADYSSVISQMPATQRRRALSSTLAEMATNPSTPIEEARRLANSIPDAGLKRAVLNSNVPGTSTPILEALRRKALANDPEASRLARVFEGQEGSTAATPDVPREIPGQGDIAPTDSDVFPPTTPASTPSQEESFEEDFYGNFGRGGHFIVPSFAPPTPVTVSGGKQIPTSNEGAPSEPDYTQLKQLAENALNEEEKYLSLRREAASGDQEAAASVAEQGEKFRDAVMALTQVDGIHNEVEASAVFLDLKRRKLLSEISDMPDGEEKRAKIKQRVEVENALHNLAYGENSPEAERILNAERGAEETDVTIAVNQIEDALNNPREVEAIEGEIQENRTRAAQVGRIIEQLRGTTLSDSTRNQLSELFEAKRKLNSDYNKLVRERSISAGTADNARLNKLSSEISQIQNRLSEGAERTPEEAARDERRLQDLTGELLLRYNNLARSGRAVDLAVEDEDADRSDRVFAKNAKEMTDRVLSHENNQFNSAEELEVLPQRYENSIQNYLSSNGGRAVYQHARLFPNSEMAKVFEFDLNGDDGASRSVAKRRFTALQQLLQNPEELQRLGLNNIDKARLEFQKDLYRFNQPREEGGHWKDEAGRVFYRPFEEDPDVIAEADSQTEAINSLITNSLEKNLSPDELRALRTNKISPDSPQEAFLYPKELYSHLVESGQHPRTQYGELYKEFGAIGHVWEDKKQGITDKDNPLVHHAANKILGDVKATEDFVNRALPKPTNPGDLLSRNRRTLGRLSRGVRLPSKDYVDRIDSGETVPRIDIPVDTPQEWVAKNYGISWGTARDNFLTDDITNLFDYNRALNQDLIDAERNYLENTPDVDEVRRAAFELDNFLFDRLKQNPDASLQDHQRAVYDFAKNIMDSDYMQQFMNRWLTPNRRELRKLEQEIEAAGGNATESQNRRLSFLRQQLDSKEKAARVRIPQSLLERGEAWLDSDPLFQNIGRAVGSSEEGQLVRYPEEKGVLDSKVRENRRKLAQKNIIEDVKAFEGASGNTIGSIKPKYALAPPKRGNAQSDDTLAQIIDVNREPISYEEARLHPTWQLVPYMHFANSPELVSEVNQYLNNLAEKTRIEGSAGGRRLLWDRSANALQAKLLRKENRDRAASLLDRNNNRDFDRFVDKLAREALQEQYGTERIDGTMDADRAPAAHSVYEDRLVPGEEPRFYNEKTMEGMGVQKPALKYEKPLAPSLYEAAGLEAPENRYEELVQNLKDRARVLLRGTPNESSLPEMAAAQDLANLILATEDRDNLVEDPRTPLTGLRGRDGSLPTTEELTLTPDSIDATLSPEEGRSVIDEVTSSNPAKALDLLSDDVLADLVDLRARAGRATALEEGRTRKLQELGTPEEYTPFRTRLDFFTDGLAESLMENSPETAARLANNPDALEETLLQRITDRAQGESEAGRPGLANFWNGRTDQQKVQAIQELASRFRVRTLPKDELSPADDEAAEKIVEQEKFAGLQLTPDPAKEGAMRVLANSVRRAKEEAEMPATQLDEEREGRFGGQGLEFIKGLIESFYGGGPGGGGGGGGAGGATPPQPPKPPTQTPSTPSEASGGQVTGATDAGALNDINVARQLMRSLQAGVPAGAMVLDPRIMRQIQDVLNNSLPRSARGKAQYLSRLQDSLIDAVDTIEQRKDALPDNEQKKNAVAALMRQRRMVEIVLRLISGLF